MRSVAEALRHHARPYLAGETLPENVGCSREPQVTEAMLTQLEVYGANWHLAWNEASDQVTQYCLRRILQEFDLANEMKQRFQEAWTAEYKRCTPPIAKILPGDRTSSHGSWNHMHGNFAGMWPVQSETTAYDMNRDLTSRGHDGWVVVYRQNSALSSSSSLWR